MTWYWWILIIAAIVFAYVNIGYLYASWCVYWATKHFIEKESIRDSDRKNGHITLTKNWQMFFILPLATIADFADGTEYITASNDNVSFLPSILHNLKGEKEENIKCYKYVMMFLWPFKLLWMLVVLAIGLLVTLVCATCYALWTYLARPCAKALTWPIRKITKLNSL